MFDFKEIFAAGDEAFGRVAMFATRLEDLSLKSRTARLEDESVTRVRDVLGFEQQNDVGETLTPALQEAVQRR